MAKHTFYTRLATPTVALALALASGCTLWAREPTYYAEVLTELFEARAEPIDACYDRYLAEVDPQASGTLSIHFEVAAKTGAVTRIEVESDKSSVPEALAACVTDELAGLKVDPPDVNSAQATFSWQFELGSRKARPTDPFVLAQKTLLSCYSAHLHDVDREATGELVIDYAFDPEAGTLARFEIVQAASTAPPAVIECAKSALESASISPEQLDDRNISGRRSFDLRYVPYQPPD